MAKRKNITPAETPPSNNSKLFANLLKTIRQYIQGRSYTPLTARELMQKLSLPDQHKDVFKDVMKTLSKEKNIKLKRGRYEYANQTPVVTGVISMHPRGFGFVKHDEPSDEGDIFIPKHLTLNAVDGDRVEVAVNTEVVSEKGPEGKVVTILSRSRTHIAGIITSISEYGEILAYVPLLGTAQEVVVIPSDDLPLKEGDRVVMKVLEWGTKDHATECSVSHCLGNISDPSCDIPAAIEEYELRGEFPDKVIKEALSFGKQVSQRDIADRKDLRDLESFTIDPTTAKDFDDALTLSKNKRGFYRLIVHIADVSHYVKEGSAIDLEASQRCNSTYFPGYCLPMLPKALSENLCSLKADVNRLTISVEMNFDTKGNLTSHKIYRSVIKSSKRFTYTSAKEVLDGKRKSKHGPTLKLMVELCNLLKVKRFERGSIEFALPDLVIKVDEKGVPFDTEYVSYDITHQMVEEFMLKANETIAMHLDKAGKGVAYRIHEEPSEENMKDFSILAGAFGFTLPEIPLPNQLQELFNEAMDTSFGQYLAVSYIRRMRQAQYSPENIGHYGLGLTHYCHFTSPIRRYVDLIIHRSLFEEGLEPKKLELITKQCSDQERISAKAENSVLLLKKLRLLNQIHVDNPGKQYDAVVTRVKNFGFSFEILDFLLEGFLHVSELDQDYFVYDDKKQHLEGRHSNKIYASGERISVMLKEVNFISLEGKWNLVGDRQGRRGPEREGKREAKREHFKSTKRKKYK
ncbi:MAG: ribonuclease R [Parachlamydiaceae bacterium]|nr:ribonuclease R [Parachlamydiaceae bacterium]